jgi:hypothetical protein
MLSGMTVVVAEAGMIVVGVGVVTVGIPLKHNNASLIMVVRLL